MSTVTFLFTDVEGSTDLVRRLGDQAYSTLLTAHHRLLRDSISSHRGQEVDTQGDAFFIAFADAPDAAAGALAIQRSVGAHNWPSGTPLRVRIGLHTGEAIRTGTGYVGIDVHRAARICSAGYGGQILVSQTARDAVMDRLPDQASLRLLGQFRLKDLQEPEALYQLVHPDLALAFPPPRTIDAIPNNLPLQLTSFIGRDRELTDVRRLFSTTRLLTLTGSGGCGKTRLALQAAAELIDEFPDGVWFVELAALTDPALVTQAAAGVLGVTEEPGRGLAPTLADAVRAKRLLLILDNCEHVVNAAAHLTESLLLAAGGLKVLATSREPLGIAGEMVYRVPSLFVPETGASLTLRDLARGEATRLFMERAMFARPDIPFTDADAAAIAQIAAALDGIPLALEMAAARLRTMTVTQIAQRINNRFGLLTGGSRTALPRHQTLQAMLDWSYDLLSEEERIVLQCVSVFPAGFTLDAAEHVCAGVGVRVGDVFGLISQLADKSMLIAGGHGRDVRYRMLDTIRQYAAERLVRSGRASVVRTGQLAWCTTFMGRLERDDVPEHERMDRIAAEYAALRTGLAWARESGDVSTAARLAVSLFTFWLVRGFWSEGRQWLEATLTAGVNVDPDVQARGLLGLARIAESQGDYEEAKTFSEAGLALQRHLGDAREVAGALRTLGNIAYGRSDYAAAQQLYEESLAYGRTAGDQRMVAATLINLAVVADHRGDFPNAAALANESLGLFRVAGDRRGTAFVLDFLGVVAADQGDDDTAEPLLQEGLTLRRELGDRRGMSASLYHLGEIARGRGDLDRARELHQESLEIRRELGDKQGIATSLAGLAMTASALPDQPAARTLWRESLSLRQGIGDRDGIAECLEQLAGLSADHVHSAMLIAAAQAVRDAVQSPGSPLTRLAVNRKAAWLKEQLGPAAFDAAVIRGRQTPLDDIVKLALQNS